MNLNFENTRLGFIDTVYESTAEQSLDADITLPDYCDDVVKILRCTVETNISSVQNISGRITADAVATVRLIYTGDSGKISYYEQNYPVEKITESDKISSDSAVTVYVKTDYVNCRAVNQRRVDIRAMLTFVFKADVKRIEELLCDANGSGVQLMKDELNVASLAGVCRKTFSMGEVFELGENKNSVSQIINVSSHAVTDEIKLINNKALLKGEYVTKIYYIPEDNDEIDFAEHSMPISQIIELDGINEKNICNMKLEVSSCNASVKADTSGNMRLVDLNAQISVFAVAFEEIPVTVVSDAYSVEYELKTAHKTTDLFEINDKIQSSFTNKVVLESIGVSVENILAAWCSDVKYKFRAKDDKCLISGTYLATVLYKDAENNLGVVSKTLDFEYSAKISKSAEKILCYGSVDITACACTVTGESKLELKTEMSVNALVLLCTAKKHICSMELCEIPNKANDKCALTICFCDEGEKIWDIARKYKTTVDAVMKENSLTEDVTQKRGMLLIPSV